ncbi:nitroreductase family protein [bacterium]|nr:nitroreductase family protein [bacterium]
MNFTELINARYSCRSFDPDRPVEREKLTACLEAAHLAPSAENSQPWRFVAVRGAEQVQRLKDEVIGGLVPNKWAKSAPVFVVLCARPHGIAKLGEGIKEIPYHLMDCGSAGEQFVLQATELGLGSCWIGWFKDKPLRQLLQLPRAWKPLAIIALGYPAEDGKRPRRVRQPLNKVAFEDSAKQSWEG